MRRSVILTIFTLLVVPACFGQGDSPLAILGTGWQHVRQAAPKKTGDNTPNHPATPMTADNKNFQRSAREQAPKGTLDPNEYSIEGRSAAIDKTIQAAETSQSGETTGFSYLAKVRNDSEKKVEIVFWEYLFTELANPANVVHRQFLCSANIKPGEKMDLLVFSTLGPSDVISAESLAKTTEKLFDEKVFINRIEYADGAILQRREWKYADVRKSVERATSTPWGTEICRSL